MEVEQKEEPKKASTSASSEREYYLDDLRSAQEFKHFLQDLLRYTAILPDEWKEDRIFIDGEYDSNQTKFEEKSNNLKIGVRARSTVKGYIALLFLRIIIDENYGFLLDNLSQDGSDYDNDVTLPSAVEKLKDVETEYTTVYAPGESIEVELWRRDDSGGQSTHTVTAKESDIDLWDLSRLDKELSAVPIEKMKGL